MHLLADTVPARHAWPAVWDGSRAFLFGGSNTCCTDGLVDAIVRYDPATGASSTMGATLPSPRYAMPAAWTGSAAYVFGGYTSGTTMSAEIVKYVPSTDTRTTLTAALPSARANAMAAWSGSHVYVFGGCVTTTACATVSKEILRLDPSDDSLVTLLDTLPEPRWGGAIAWTGSAFYVFGGCTDAACPTDDVVRYDPATGTATTLAGSLPTPIRSGGSSAAVWDGRHVFVLGGCTGSPGVCAPTTDAIVRFDPATEEVVTIADVLTTPRAAFGVAWTGHVAYLLGGCDCSANVDDVLTFEPPNLPPAPGNLGAATGPGAGEITLTWAAPGEAPHPSGGAVTAYRVYRGDAPGGETFLRNVGNLTTFVDAGLGNGVTKCYRVAAVNSAGEGALSAGDCARTGVPPGAPRNLTTTTQADLQHVDLDWEAPLDDGGLVVTKYVVYRRAVPGGESPVADVPAGQTAYTDLPPTFGVYEYRVSAVNPAGEGPKSNASCALGGRIVPGGEAAAAAAIREGCGV